jgi:hypothetical protein
MSKKRLPHGTNHNRRAVKPPYTPPVPTNTRELLDGYQVNFSPAMAEQGFSQSQIHECVEQFVDAFTETAEPEEVLDFLREYHGALGPLVSQFEGTLDQFSGDGIMAFFNDPIPVPDPAERAVRMSMAMREAAGALIAEWRERGRDLGFGAGIAQGYATLGQIGFSERSGYTAIGTVCNVAARLCA